MEQATNQIRTFIAIRLTDELRGSLAVFAGKFKKVPGNIRWVDPEQMHLTLHFLGDVDAPLIPKIMKACQVAARNIPPFRLEFCGSGVFPNFKKPRVVWVGAREGKEIVEKLHAALSEQLGALGLKLDDRPFTAHLTIGRIKFIKQVGGLKQVINKTSSEVVGNLDILKVSVFKSVLTPKGPEYTILGETYLKGE